MKEIESLDFDVSKQGQGMSLSIDQEVKGLSKLQEKNEILMRDPGDNIFTTNENMNSISPNGKL